MWSHADTIEMDEGVTFRDAVEAAGGIWAWPSNEKGGPVWVSLEEWNRRAGEEQRRRVPGPDHCQVEPRAIEPGALPCLHQRGEHLDRMALYAVAMARHLSQKEKFRDVITEEWIEDLFDAAPLHDIGKVGIPDKILLKPGKLTPDEQKVMQQHPIIGEAIVKPVRSLQSVGTLVRCHHERYDGTGYPSGLKGDEVPLGARILMVADAYDSMVTDRPYRKRLPQADAIAELQRCAGTDFDPNVVEVFVDLIDERSTRTRRPTRQSKSA